MNRKLLWKMLVILALTIGLTIPTLMIRDLVAERSAYRFEARQSIAASWTGEQTLYGPVLVVPYQLRHEKKVWDSKREKYRMVDQVVERQLFVLPESLRIDADVRTEERSRGIYSIPVYSSEIQVEGSFSNKALRELLRDKAVTLHADKVFLSVPVSDIRGIAAQPVIDWNGSDREFTSGSGIAQHGSGMRVLLGGLGSAAEQTVDFRFAVQLRGMERLQFSPVGKTTTVNIRSPWQHPGFLGRYLPNERSIGDTGFEAEWQLASFSGDMDRAAEQCQQGQCDLFLANTFGVGLVQPVDIYHQAERSVKYALLIIVLTFVAFFLFEVMRSVALHPMQYLLVGCSLTVFYLLLVSLSEHMAFGWAYLTATLANVSLIGAYVSAVLKGRGRAAILTGALLAMYGMLFLILRSEDNALLMGSLLIFGVLAFVMMLTRNLDWYQVSEQVSGQVGIGRRADAGASSS